MQSVILLSSQLAVTLLVNSVLESSSLYADQGGVRAHEGAHHLEHLRHLRRAEIGQTALLMAYFGMSKHLSSVPKGMHTANIYGNDIPRGAIQIVRM